MTLLAYHGDPAVKAKYVERMKAHKAADEIVQRIGWDSKKHRGCAVGCTLESYDPGRYPIELGIPVELARLEDAAFEGLPAPEAPAFAVAFLESIPVGADLSLAAPRFVRWLLTSSTIGLQTIASSGGRQVVFRAVQLYDRVIAGDTPSEGEWIAVRDAAGAVQDFARGVVRGAAVAAVETAWSAARANQGIGWAYWDAAWSAARVAAGDGDIKSDEWDAGRVAAWRVMAAELLAILAACPVPADELARS